MPRLLIVEDDLSLPESIADTLDGLCQTKVARTVAAARHEVKRWKPDFVLSDVVLPDGDGIALCRTLKAQPETSGVIVVLLTGLASRETMVDGWKAGADDYILKPFHPPELTARIRGLLGAAESRRQAQELQNLRAREKFQRDFVANISHELRTPIAAIKGFAETLRRSPAETERRAFLRRIERQADRLTLLVDDLLTLARLEASGGEGWADELSLSDFLSEFVAGGGGAGRGRPLVEATVQPGLRVRGDRDQLRHALENLLANARRYKATRIHVRAERRGRAAHVSVQDDGAAIPAENLDRVFDHFFRPGARQDSADTGLGLSIVRRVVEAHGGRVWAGSDGDRGSTLCFSLPLLAR